MEGKINPNSSLGTEKERKEGLFLKVSKAGSSAGIGFVGFFVCFYPSVQPLLLITK